MLWCILSLAILVTLFGLAALTAPIPRVPLPRPHPGALLRGCLALLCLVVALGLGGLALLLGR